MWKEVVQKNGAQSLFKILAALPSIDMESLKFQLYCSYILVIGTNKIIFKYKYIKNNSLSFFQWIFWLSLSILTSWFYTSHHPRGTENNGLAHFPCGHIGSDTRTGLLQLSCVTPHSKPGCGRADKASLCLIITGGTISWCSEKNTGLSRVKKTSYSGGNDP